VSAPAAPSIAAIVASLYQRRATPVYGAQSIIVYKAHCGGARIEVAD
jgi:hypothetical protein